MHHNAIGGGAFTRAHVPLLRRGLYEYRTGGGAGASHRDVVRYCRSAADTELPAIRRIQITLHDGHLLPLHIKLFGDDHGQRRLDALPHLRVRRDDRDSSTRCDADKDVGCKICNRRESRRRRRFGDGDMLGRVQRARNQQPAAGQRTDLDELTSIECHSRFPLAGVAVAANSAARLMPARIRVYDAQRHKFLAIAVSISASVGCGVDLSNAAAARICPP